MTWHVSTGLSLTDVENDEMLFTFSPSDTVKPAAWCTPPS